MHVVHYSHIQVYTHTLKIINISLKIWRKALLSVYLLSVCMMCKYTV